MSQQRHEAAALPLEERMSYLSVVASIAGADVELAAKETQALRELCARLELPEEETQKILATAARPTASIERHVEELRGSALRFTLMADCLLLAFADGEYAAAEQQEIEQLAQALQIDDKQLAALKEFARAAVEAAQQEGGTEKHGRELAAKLAAVGVPVSALAATSAWGLATAGATSGLGALALGLGIASGFGVVLGLGIGSFVGVRWLAKHL